jgi:phage shock protein PspC (stress-responsive transcriptional regulator)
MIGHRARHALRGGSAWLVPSRTDRVLAGVAGGIGERLGVDPVIVRLSFAVLALAGGFGVLLYAVLWLAGSRVDPDGTLPSSFGPGSSAERALSVALVVSGMLLLLRAAGLWFGDGLVWPIAVAAFGSAVLWGRSEHEGRGRLARMARRLPRSSFRAIVTGDVSPGRILLGTVLIVAGMGAFLAAHDAFAAIRGVAAAIVVTVAGLALLVGPLVWQQGRQLAAERR